MGEASTSSPMNFGAIEFFCQYMVFFTVLSFEWDEQEQEVRLGKLYISVSSLLPPL